MGGLRQGKETVTPAHMLEALCFDFDVVHPYDYIVQLVQRFAPGNSTLGKCGWAFINDRCDSSILLLTVVIGR